MELDPHTLFFGNSIDISMQVESVKQYIIHMDDSLKNNMKAFNKKHKKHIIKRTVHY